LIALAVVTIVAGVVLHRSVLGRYLFAIGKNEEAPATPPSRHRASTAPSQFIAV
jgi:ribose transport system permease protein